LKNAVSAFEVSPAVLADKKALAGVEQRNAAA
jgi:hypothetical protein